MAPGSIVGVLTTRFHVEIIKAPVLKLLTKILNTNTRRKMKLTITVKTKDSIKVPWRPVEKVFPLLQRI